MTVAAPKDWCASVLAKGDTLAQLAKDAGITAAAIAAGNGVPLPPDPKKPPCAWGRAVAQWVLATGGVRMPVVAGSLNACEPGQGHVAFVPGQVIMLPHGVRQCAAAPSTPVKTAAKVGAGFLLLLAAAAAYALRRKKHP